MPEKNLEKIKQEEYLGPLMREIDMETFLKKPKRNDMKLSEIEIPPIEIIKTAADIVIPPIEIDPKKPAGAPAAEGGLPPLPGADAKGGLPPLPGAGGGLPPLPGAGGGLPPVGDAAVPPGKKGLTEKDKEDILASIQQLQDKLDDATGEVRLAIMRDSIMDDVKEYHRDLEKEIKSLKDRKIPEREFFDTEGTYKEHLYSMATQMLDDFLPKLFDEIPEYSFIATQVSRIFDDGTVADALIAVMARVIHKGMKYDFKIDIPVLNGLMQYPLYIQRNQKIIPLTKPEVQKELDSLSYRKEDVADDLSMNKNNKSMFKNIGENLNRKPDHQKWYNVKPNVVKPVGLGSDHVFSPQRGQTKF